MKCLRNDSGFSLIQVLLVSAALSTSALVAIQTFKTQKDDIREVDIKDKVEQVHNAIYSILQNRNHCLETIVNSPGSLTIAPNDVRAISEIRTAYGNPSDPPAFVVGEANRYLQGSVSIKDMILTFPADLKDLATLTITYNRHGNKRTGDSDLIRKSFPMSIQRSEPDQIHSCTSVTVGDGVAEAGNDNLSKDICETFDLFNWNDELRLCEIKQNLCPEQTIFSGIDEATGDKICKPFIDFLPHMLETTDTQSCPDDYNQIKFTRSFHTYFKVSIECNKEGTTCPSRHEVKWNDGPSDCVGQLPRGLDGNTFTIQDVTTLETGSIPYYCDKGTWKPQNSDLICIAPCAGRTITWGSNCSGVVPTVQNGQTADTTDTTLPSIGNARFKCNDGVWGGVSSVCSTPCNAATVSWTIGGVTCSDSLPASDDGDTMNAIDSSTPQPEGSAKYKCVNGTFQRQSTPASTCTMPPQPGTCKWNRTISWENTNCTGFQLNSTPNTTDSVHVSSPAACTSQCGVCKGGGISYDGCVFTPDP